MSEAASRLGEHLDRQHGRDRAQPEVGLLRALVEPAVGVVLKIGGLSTHRTGERERDRQQHIARRPDGRSELAVGIIGGKALEILAQGVIRLA